MAQRPVWKGQIRLSLVQIPVEIYSATKAGGTVRFRQIHRETGKRVHSQQVVDGVGPVDRDEIVKGYRVDRDDYVLLEDEEIDDVRLETKKTLSLVQFVDTGSIPPLYFDKPYYVVPQDELAEDAYRVLRDALRQSGRTGLGQLAMRGKEYLIAVRPCGQGLLLETLHYESEVREAGAIFEDIDEEAPDAELLDVAAELIDRKSGTFDAAAFKDHYNAAVRDLIEEKRKANGTSAPDDEQDDGAGTSGSQSGDNVVDLMASLKQSLEKDKPGKGKKSGSSSGKKKASGSSSSASGRAGSKSTGGKGGSKPASKKRKSA